MSDRAVHPNPAKDPDEWVTGDEPMTGPQQSYLQTLAQEAQVDVPEGLSKAAASKLIDELQARTGRRGAASTEPDDFTGAGGPDADPDTAPGHPAGSDRAVSAGEVLSGEDPPTARSV